MSKNNLPNELVIQLDGQKLFDEMTKEEKLREIEYCIERCYMNYEDDDLDRQYLNRQVKHLEKLKKDLGV